MLLRMYTRWAERRRFKVEVLEVHDGEEAGIKSATMLIKGHNAYGWLKTESGVHRLVRISPYDSNARRHTSFASVWVYPVIDDSIEIDINEIGCAHRYLPLVGRGRPARQHDQFGGAHHPSCRPASRSPARAERSQHKNRAKAWEMLRARLYEEELKKREAAANADRGLEDRYRLGPPDPLLRAAALSAGEGPAHRRREHQPVGRARRRPRRLHGSIAVAAHRRRRRRSRSPTSTEVAAAASAFRAARRTFIPALRKASGLIASPLRRTS